MEIGPVIKHIVHLAVLGPRVADFPINNPGHPHDPLVVCAHTHARCRGISADVVKLVDIQTRQLCTQYMFKMPWSQVGYDKLYVHQCINLPFSIIAMHGATIVAIISLHLHACIYLCPTTTSWLQKTYVKET